MLSSYSPTDRIGNLNTANTPTLNGAETDMGLDVAK